MNKITLSARVAALELKTSHLVDDPYAESRAAEADAERRQAERERQEEVQRVADAEVVERKRKHRAAVEYLIQWAEDHGPPSPRDLAYLASLTNEKHPGTRPGGGTWGPSDITGTLAGRGVRCPSR